VIAHGHSRVTHDLDLVIAMDDINISRAIECLTNLGFSPRLPVAAADFCDATIRKRWIEEKNLQVFSMINESMGGLVIDLFAEEPFDFRSEYSKAALIALPGIEAHLPFVGKETLITMKRLANRSIDRDDIKHLTATE